MKKTLWHFLLFLFVFCCFLVALTACQPQTVLTLSPPPETSAVTTTEAGSYAEFVPGPAITDTIPVLLEVPTPTPIDPAWGEPEIVQNGSSTETTYYSNGKAVKQIVQVQYISGINHINVIYDNQYDAQGRLLQYESYSFDDTDTLTEYAKQTYVYNTAGDILKDVLVKFNQNLHLQYMLSVTYDLKNHQRTDFTASGENGYLTYTRGIIYSIKDGDYQTIRSVETEYYSQSKVIHKLYETDYGANNRAIKETISQYRVDGRIYFSSVSEGILNQNGVAIGKIVTETEYDTEEKPIRIVCSEYDRADKLVEKKEIFPA